VVSVLGNGRLPLPLEPLELGLEAALDELGVGSGKPVLVRQSVEEVLRIARSARTFARP
jgi:hypothetical protein